MAYRATLHIMKSDDCVNRARERERATPSQERRDEMSLGGLGWGFGEQDEETPIQGSQAPKIAPWKQIELDATLTMLSSTCALPGPNVGGPCSSNLMDSRDPV